MGEYENWDTTQYYEEEFEQSESFDQIYINCVTPTLVHISPYIWRLLMTNFFFKIATQTIFQSEYVCHIFSSLFGFFALFFMLRSSLEYVIIFVVYSYLIFVITLKLKSYSAYCLSGCCIFYLIASEFAFPIKSIWQECRGLHMVISMKVISLAFDIKNNEIKSIPNMMEYFGYILCPANCIFGPWISYNTYRLLFDNRISIWSVTWMKHTITYIFYALVFLCISNCWSFWLIPPTSRWAAAYQEALSFRSSHYFVSFLSQAAMAVGGFEFGGISPIAKKESSNSFEVTRPMHIEFPRSLVQVVIFWDIPMHMWLKNYVFSVCKPMGSLIAVFCTYSASSFLHGFNIKLASVLLSLGFYTYVEYKLRNKLSVIFDACIKAKPCKKCTHVYKTSLYVTVVNFMFSLLVVFHLAYLGCLLEDTNSEENESYLFSKWLNLSFASHLVTLFLYSVYKLI